jgi:phosphoribosylamine--glycine ligase
MKILVVGGGGREHAIVSALARNKETEIFSVMANRNPGISRLARDVSLCKETDIPRIVSYAKKSGVVYAFIGPEAPLEAGIVDHLEAEGIGCVGPTQAAARTDPADAVSFINNHEEDLAIKPIGLTGGKGVRIMGEQVDRAGAIRYVKSLKGGVVLEERLIGEEFTLQAFVDGTHLIPMPLVQDHKRAFEGDLGPNTGGMGSYSMPDHMLPFVSETDYKKAISIMTTTVAAMERSGHPYKGILYGQFMNTARGPKVIEFNARFGDPEAMNVLSLLCSDLSDIVIKITEGSLSSSDVTFDRKATVCKYIVPEGYPDSPARGDPLTIGTLDRALLYYANVEEREGKLSTLSSRTLAFVGIGSTLEEAEERAELSASTVKGRVRYRRDIGTGELLKKRMAHMKELR